MHRIFSAHRQLVALKILLNMGLYLIDKGGEDVVALGTDFDGIPPDTEIADMSQMSRLYDAFKEAGLSVEQCEKVILEKCR